MATPHLDKLNATLNNDKLPVADRERIRGAITRYYSWIAQLGAVNGQPDQALRTMVSLLDEYKRYIDLEVIFDSPEDFLYRQKGQLKLDNSIIEEFLPWIFSRTIQDAALPNGFLVGPNKCYSAVYFDSRVSEQRPGAGIQIRTKNQDFAISKRLFIKSSHFADFTDSAVVETNIGYIATEIKTNLDKTMFQEACATARDLRLAVPSSKYFLMCEWLDMTPVSTAPTDVEEVLIVRKGKRLSSQHRKTFNTAAGRRQARQSYEEHLINFPFAPEVFQRWRDHILSLFNDEDPVEDDVLTSGYF